jgi:hypothetical protein
MRPLRVVVRGVLSEHPTEVLLAEDQRQQFQVGEVRVAGEPVITGGVAGGESPSCCCCSGS